ncbi:hypothetical protein CLAFUW4_20093 [Fulvia fulva]|nr:hypothetical protein CLAFUR4_20093 [Fulvia fulva]WPV19258.1 hypothetical protein CLAFUW4_20093 [Fulvia fulva]WPV33897.1 hypothetical protein CLAFUW7_20093 [Fulvia fulva]
MLHYPHSSTYTKGGHQSKSFQPTLPTMHFFTLLVGLSGLSLITAQEVCGSDCYQYPYDALGRVDCPGSTFLGRLFNTKGDCQRYFELVGGYGCCCGCPGPC